ncbi:BolA family protein [Frigidibacter mobilis]|uniref:BolA family protein n=1 Tax=Frigidibacter mobilis TaxID=1335048 RepID=A0A159Z2X0_9RHOB|nr:BolA family protein [Frigidibacter mobilis]AMY68474.1 BolA family protein [Frigidibacter mobilis]
MTISEEIRQRLQTRFAPELLAVVDESEGHRGHAGWREGGETHFRVRIRAAELGPMSRLARHRAVHGALGPGLMARLHALALEADG